MTEYDHGKYVGPIRAYKGKVAQVRAHPATSDEPLFHRNVFVKWLNPNTLHHEHRNKVGRKWHLMPVKDFRIVAKSQAD